MFQALFLYTRRLCARHGLCSKHEFQQREETHPSLHDSNDPTFYTYGSTWVVSMISSDLIPCMCTSFRTFTIDSGCISYVSSIISIHAPFVRKAWFMFQA